MAIAHVSTTTGFSGTASSSISTSFTISAGTGRKIILRFGNDQSTPFGNLTAVTFDGQACTFVAEAQLDNGSFETSVHYYYFDVPDATGAGSKNFSATWSQTNVERAWAISEYTGMALGDPVAIDTTTATSSPISSAATAPAGNSLGLDVVAANVLSNFGATGTNHSEVSEVDVSDYSLAVGSAGYTTSGSKTMSWTSSAGARIVHAMAIWAEASGVAGVLSGAGVAAAPTADGDARLLGKLAGDADAAAPTASGALRILARLSGAATSAAATGTGRVRLIARLSGAAVSSSATGLGVARLLGKLTGAGLAGAPVGNGRSRLLGKVSGAGTCGAPTASGVLRLPPTGGSLAGVATVSAPLATGRLSTGFGRPTEPVNSPPITLLSSPVSPPLVYPIEPTGIISPENPTEPVVNPSFSYPAEPSN
jgi:hypothetical protein